MTQLIKNHKNASKRKGKKRNQEKKKKKKSLFQKPEGIFQSKKLHLDKRIYIQFSEFNQRCMDGFFATPKKKQRIMINKYNRVDKNRLEENGTFRFMDIAYLILEMYEGTDFPNLSMIKDPSKKYKPAIVKVGSEEDEFPKELQERDLNMILQDIPMTNDNKSVICYRIRRRNYERLMQKLMWEAVPRMNPNWVPLASSILHPLTASNNGKKNFFHYLIGGHLMLKDGSCYKLTSIDDGFDHHISEHIQFMDDSLEEE